MKTSRLRFRFLIPLVISLLLVVAANGYTQSISEEPAKASNNSTGTASKPLSSEGSDVGDEEYGASSNNQGASSGGFGGGPGFFGANPHWIQGDNIMISASKENDELRGFSHRTGEWTNLKIEPQEKLDPIVGTDVAAVRVGDSMAAYSGTTGTWDVLKLSPGSKAYATVGSNVVQTTDTDYLYTFAASKGKWTSPNDPKFRRSRRSDDSLSGSSGMYGPMISGMGLGAMTTPQKRARLDHESLNLAQQFRGKGLDDPEARAKLTQAVTAEFDSRLNHQKAEAARLQEKLQEIQDAIERRDALRERIIQRRVDELLDPNVEWDSLAPSIPGTPIGLPGPTNLPLGTPARAR